MKHIAFGVCFVLSSIGIFYTTLEAKQNVPMLYGFIIPAWAFFIMVISLLKTTFFERKLIGVPAKYDQIAQTYNTFNGLGAAVLTASLVYYAINPLTASVWYGGILLAWLFLTIATFAYIFGDRLWRNLVAKNRVDELAFNIQRIFERAHTFVRYAAKIDSNWSDHLYFMQDNKGFIVAEVFHYNAAKRTAGFRVLLTTAEAFKTVGETFERGHLYEVRAVPPRYMLSVCLMHYGAK